MAEDTRKQESVWTYSEKPGNVASAAAGTMVAVLGAIVLFSYGLPIVSYALLVPGMVAGWYFHRMSRNTTIAMDAEGARLIKREKLLFTEKLTIIPLREFSAVKMTRQGSLVEEGYGVIRYGIALEGSGTSLEVYSTEDEQQGRMIRQMLMQYLGLTKDAAPGDGTDITTIKER
jgi:hypothetical protein